MASARAWLLQSLIAALVAVLAAGSGLGGWVSALSGPPAHVCTCTSGGTHARCPVCNPSLGRQSRSLLPIVDGTPCGERSFALGSGLEPVLASPPCIEAAPPPPSEPATWPNTSWAYEDISSRPPIPPPRAA
jgi:hypothetical protein